MFNSGLLKGETPRAAPFVSLISRVLSIRPPVRPLRYLWTRKLRSKCTVRTVFCFCPFFRGSLSGFWYVTWSVLVSVQLVFAFCFGQCMYVCQVSLNTIKRKSSYFLIKCGKWYFFARWLGINNNTDFGCTFTYVRGTKVILFRTSAGRKLLFT